MALLLSIRSLTSTLKLNNDLQHIIETKGVISSHGLKGEIRTKYSRFGDPNVASAK
jgi:hypothetical protein